MRDRKSTLAEPKAEAEDEFVGWGVDSSFWHGKERFLDELVVVSPCRAFEEKGGVAQARTEGAQELRSENSSGQNRNK
jgi:hypothetical protein